MKQRIFLAFRIRNEEIVKELQAVQKKLENLNKKAHITWSKSRSFHITLEFLGEINDVELAKLKEITLEIVNKYHKFKFWLDRLDGFPNQTSAKIINMRVGEEGKIAESLQGDLVYAFKENNLVKEIEPWKAHITLARNRGEHLIQGFNTISFEKKVFEIATVDIIRSDSEFGGAKYTTLESYELAS